MASIRLESLRKVYPGGVVALPEMNLEIEDGEFVVLVGPSGCGKTTIMRMIAGFLPPSAGRLEVDGVEAAHAGAGAAVVDGEYPIGGREIPQPIAAN